jgi:hypothetical protein
VEIVQDRCFLQVIPAFWDQFRISIWGFYVRCAIRLVIYYFRLVLFCKVTINSIGSGPNFSWSCMDYTKAWYQWAFSGFGHPFGSSSHSYCCMSCLNSKSVVFQLVVIFYHKDPSTGYIQRSKPWIDDPRVVPNTSSSFTPNSSLNF